MNNINRKLTVPKVDLKKKPSFELLRLISKQSASDITPHPFSKVKPPKEQKIEEIFIKGGSKKKDKDTMELSKKKLKKKSK